MFEKRSVDFKEAELERLKDGDCIEKEIDGSKIIVCGQKGNFED